MTYTLKLCIGLTFGICNSAKTIPFPDYESCDRERSRVIETASKHEGEGIQYAICAPVIQEPTK